MSPRRLFATFAVMTLAVLPALAKPNFSGDWKLNLAKSSFGEMPAPTSMTLKITHEEPKLTTATKQSSEMGDFEMQGHLYYRRQGVHQSGLRRQPDQERPELGWRHPADRDQGTVRRQRIHHVREMGPFRGRQNADAHTLIQERDGRGQQKLVLDKA